MIRARTCYNTSPMAWDSTRPVPWTRLMREWVIYALIMSTIFLLFFRDASVVGALAGLLVSGPLYLMLGFVLAKFGYQRKTIRQMRSERQNPPSPSPEQLASTPRPKPPPTSRTSTGPSQRPKPRRKR